MAKLTIDDLDLCGKRVLVRVDFNVPLKDGKITDDTRIRRTLPTVRKIIGDRGRAILMSHLGRPKGKVVPKMSLRPVAERLGELLGKPVGFTPDCIGPAAAKAVGDLTDGGVILLENLRYHKEETDNDPGFAEKLAALGDLYVNDAFGTAHRAHASTAGVTKYFDRCAAGYLMQKEIDFLGRLLDGFQLPFVAVLGGAKISGKIEVIQNLLGKVDALLIGGGMAFTFYKAKGMAIGKSLLEDDKITLAATILKNAEKDGKQLILPRDCVCATEIKSDAATTICESTAIGDDQLGLDIGPATAAEFGKILKSARTIFWNGPMGVFETPPFDRGTLAVAEAIAETTDLGAVSIVGGGDSVAAVNAAGLAERISHVSTGGGASLEFVEGKTLPGIAALTDKKEQPAESTVE